MENKNVLPYQKLFKEGIIAFPEEKGKKPYMIASKCKKCGKVYFPKREICIECFGEELEEVELSREADLYTFTVVHIGVKGFQTPYILAWVTFPEGVRIVSQLDCHLDDAERLVPGQKLEFVVGKLSNMDDGSEIIGYKFKPIFEKGEDR